MNFDEFVFGRHTQRAEAQKHFKSETAAVDDPESTKFEGITKKGERMVKDTVLEELVPLIKELDKDAVIFLGGATETTRTRSTGEAEGAYLSMYFKDHPSESAFVLTRRKIEAMREKSRESGGKVLDDIAALIDEHKDERVVVAYPLRLKGWTVDQTPEGKAYFNAINTLANQDTSKVMKLWLENPNSIEFNGETLPGHPPDDVARDMLRDINRLRTFAKRFSKDRQLVTSITGHAAYIDALVIYLIGQGKMEQSAFEEAGGDVIKQAEIGSIAIESDGTVEMTYRGKHYNVLPSAFEELTEDTEDTEDLEQG